MYQIASIFLTKKKIFVKENDTYFVQLSARFKKINKEYKLEAKAIMLEDKFQVIAFEDSTFSKSTPN